MLNLEHYGDSYADRYKFDFEGFYHSEFSCGSYVHIINRSVGLMASKRNQLQDETRMRVLRLLDENANLSTRDIADAVGISNGSAFYCINALVEKGLVKLGNFTASQHKNRYAYILTPRGVVEKTALTQRFLARKMAEYEALRAEIDDLRADVEGELSERGTVR